MTDHLPNLDLSLPDDASMDHPKVQELRDLVLWSEGQVWCSPERHGAMSAVFKAQIDWIPLALGAVRPTQGKTLAAHVHYPESVFGAKGLYGIRR